MSEQASKDAIRAKVEAAAKEYTRREQSQLNKPKWIVPIAGGATGVILVAGLYSFFQGHNQRSQVLMRARVVAQGTTIALMMGSLYLAALPNADQASSP